METELAVFRTAEDSYLHDPAKEFLATLEKTMYPRARMKMFLAELFIEA